MKTVSLYPNQKRDPDFQITSSVIDRILSHSAEVKINREYRNFIQKEDPKILWVSEEELFYNSEALITLGGDGTILSVASRAADADLPVFGINLGNVGFMTAIEKGETEKVDALFDGQYSTSSRMILSCLINGKEELLAMNEVVIAPEKGFHIVDLSLKADDKKICDFRADGLIFNTPTGSTGYSFSAGGAVIDAAFDCIGVKTISSYLLINAHHMIFSPETVFSVSESRESDSPIVVCADGRHEKILQKGDRITIRKSKKRIRLLFLNSENNIESFFRKF